MNDNIKGTQPASMQRLGPPTRVTISPAAADALLRLLVDLERSGRVNGITR